MAFTTTPTSTSRHDERGRAVQLTHMFEPYTGRGAAEAYLDDVADIYSIDRRWAHPRIRAKPN